MALNDYPEKLITKRDAIECNFIFALYKEPSLIDDYKNDVSVKAIAENASCDFDYLENMISTINIPLYKQKRLITKDIYKDFTSFDSFSTEL